jgi:purine-binding chemotaxis protein CheW
MEFGILADAILGVRLIPQSKIQRTLPTLTDIRVEYLEGVTPERTIILDAVKLLADKKIRCSEEE